MIHAEDVLDAAAARVRKGHAQGANALNAEGRKVSPFSDEAVAWDACGALLVEGREAAGQAFSFALHAYAKEVGVTGYEDALDHRSPDTASRTREMAEKVWEWEDAIPPALAPGKVALALTRAKGNLP